MTFNDTILGCRVRANVYFHRDIFGNYDNVIDDIEVLNIDWDVIPKWVDELYDEYDHDYNHYNHVRHLIQERIIEEIELLHSKGLLT